MVVLVVRVLNPSNALLSDPKKDVKEELPYPLIIGASCGGIFVIVLASICLVRHCHRQERIENRRVSNGMPPEVPHPSPHNYELKETRSKEDIVNYEELGVWKDTGMYEKLHFSNGETRYQELGIHNMAADYQEIGKPNDSGHYQEIGKAYEPERYQEIGTFKIIGKKWTTKLAYSKICLYTFFLK